MRLEGTCFLLKAPNAWVLAPPARQHVCELARASWRWRWGSTVERPQTPAWTLPPSVIPPPGFLLPDELWLAGLIVCARQTNVGSLTGLSNLHPSLPTTSTWQIKVFSPLHQPSSIWGHCWGSPHTSVHKSHAQFVRKEDFSGSEYTGSMCNLFQEVSVTGSLLVILLKLQKNQDGNLIPSMSLSVTARFGEVRVFSSSYRQWIFVVADLVKWGEPITNFQL